MIGGRHLAPLCPAPALDELTFVAPPVCDWARLVLLFWDPEAAIAGCGRGPWYWVESAENDGRYALVCAVHLTEGLESGEPRLLSWLTREGFNIWTLSPEERG